MKTYLNNSLKTLAALLVSATAICAAEEDKNVFVNTSVGLTVTKPADWQFVSADQHLENVARTQLNDQQMQEAMQKHATAPLVVMMKHPEPFDDLNPSFKVNIKPLGNISGEDPVAIINLLTGSMGKMFKDFKIVEGPTETTISGLKAAHVRIHYSLQIPDGRTFPTASDLWVVPRGKYFFLIGAGIRQDEKTGSHAEVDGILSSLKLEAL